MFGRIISNLRQLWQTDPSKVRTPSGMSRRHFLQAMGVTSVSVSMGGLILPKTDVFYFADPHFIGRGPNLNEDLFDQLSLADPFLERKAINAVNDFTRTKMREDGFLRRIMPPIEISNDLLDRSVMTNPGNPLKPVGNRLTQAQSREALFRTLSKPRQIT